MSCTKVLNATMLQCYNVTFFFQCLESIFSIHPSRRQRETIERKDWSVQKPRFFARRSSIMNVGGNWSKTLWLAPRRWHSPCALTYSFCNASPKALICCWRQYSAIIRAKSRHRLDSLALSCSCSNR